MTRASFDRLHAHVEPHDHAVHVYEKEDDLLPPLAAFIDEGLRLRQSSVFVHSFPDEEAAWRFVLRAHPDAEKLRRDQLVLVSLYRDAFQGGSPRIDYDHVNEVVGGLVSGARANRRTGVRIFVDASRRYFAEGRVDEWFRFESWLGRRLQADVGLVCAYQAADVMRPDVLPRVLDTHAYRFGP
jgi:hypothetical protein